MFYPDLSPADERTTERFHWRSWENFELNLPLLYVGWLDIEEPFSQGLVTPQFVEALRRLCQNPVEEWKGHHTCSFCGRDPRIESRGRDRMLGSADIEVVGEEAAYYSPAMTLHYVEEHEYLPPQGFIDAVLGAEEREANLKRGRKAKITRLQAKEDDGRDDYWRWPIDRKPNENGLFEDVYIFREKMPAILLQQGLASLGYTSEVGEMNLEKWVEGKISLNIGAMRETYPGDIFPRLKSAFYVHAFTKDWDMLNCLVSIHNIEIEGRRTWIRSNF